MTHVRADRVKETTTGTGTGNLTLAGAVTAFQAFSAVCSNADEFLYCIAHQTLGEWEVGLGTYVSATPAIARGTVLSSSNAGSLVNFSAGTKDVFICDVATRLMLPTLTADPAAPAAGAYMYSRNQAGRYIPRFIGPSGLDSAVQPCFWGNAITLWMPSTGTSTGAMLGVSWTISTTQSHPTIADTNVMTSMRRATYTTTTTAGNQSGVRSTAPLVMRNRGFFFAARFGILTYTATMQVFVGLAAAATALAGQPSAVNNAVFMGKDSDETEWKVTTRDASTASETSTGETTVAAGNTAIYDFYAYCKPSDSKITVRVVDVGDYSTVLDNTEKSSNLPVGTTPLYAHAECRNSAGGSGSAVAIFLAKIYVESDL